jgi:hypothetical protein
LGVGKTLFQIKGLLALRRDDVRDVTGSFQTVADFPQRMAFPRSRAATEQCDKITRPQHPQFLAHPAPESCYEIITT